MIRYVIACTAALVLIVIALMASLDALKPQVPTGTAPTAYVVVDGDTIRSPAGITYRLVGFDTPETFRAKCSAEYQLGLKAKARLEALIASGTARLIETGRLDRYQRTLARLTVDGRDVAGILIGEGLARPYSGRGRREGWCP